LEPRKGVDILLDALAAVPGAELRIVGVGREEERLRQQAARLGIDARVEFRGYRAAGELLAEYRWADAFAMPSVYEGMPLTVLEAKACGLAVATAPFQGAAALVPEGTGLICADGDARAMAMALRQLAESSSLTASMGRRARADAVERFSWDAAISRVAATLMGVLERDHADDGGDA
jgi:glycosyltransferase involved in cell wall biosynthesis